MYAATTDWAMEECKCWRLPIFTPRRQGTIFGTTELNFRVRYGNGWTLCVINTNFKLWPFGQYIKRTQVRFNQTGDSCGNRTRVAGVRGRSLNRLTNEPFFKGLIVVSPLLLVHHQGLEPGTPWLRVRCSTNWANGAFFSRFIGSILWKGWILDFVRPMNRTFRPRVLSNALSIWSS